MHQRQRGRNLRDMYCDLHILTSGSITISENWNYISGSFNEADVATKRINLAKCNNNHN